MSGEGSLFDVPPAAFGRFRVLHQVGAGSTGPVFRGEDPESGTAVAIKAFRVNLPPERAHEVAGELTRLVARSPRYPALAAPLAAGLSGIEPYLVTMLIPGQSLDAALRDFGPAAIGDLLPRLGDLANALDLGAERGIFHGALHPRDLVVAAEHSVLTGLGVAPVLAAAGARVPSRRPYAAPELAEGRAPNAASDQYAFAAIAFEWMTGRRVAGPADKPVDFPAMPGIDRARIAAALSRALARDPGARYRNVREFVDALAAGVADEAVAAPPAGPAARTGPAPSQPGRAAVPALPLDDGGDEEPEPAVEEEEEDEPTPAPLITADEAGDDAAPDPPRFASITDDEPSDASAPGLRLVTPPAQPPSPAPSPALSGAAGGAIIDRPAADPVAWQGGTLAASTRQGYGAGALVVAAVLGAAAGFGGAFVILDRAATGVPGRSAGVTPADAGEDAAIAPRTAPAPPRPETAAKTPGSPPPAAAAGAASTRPVAPATIAIDPPAPSKPPPPPPSAARTRPATPTGSLLIRSVPNGSVVSVDGVRKGVTPLTVRELPLGTRQILVERTGYAPAERTVALTSGRPSRSLDVRLTALPSRPPAAASAPPAKAGPAETTGGLLVESRPSGARATINGVFRGTTPLSLDSLAPGAYQVTLELAGYQPFTTTVTVTAGTRARAAGSLVMKEEQE